jgi:hypothetical protein
MTTVNRGPQTANMPKGPLFLRYATVYALYALLNGIGQLS